MTDCRSIIVIGMRGAGKSTYGKLAADTLGYEFVDLDDVLESQQGCSCATVVENNGWAGFRQIETEILKAQVGSKPERTVFACGGGIVESESAREFLKLQPFVVSINTQIEDIIEYLNRTATSTASGGEGLERRPNYGEEIMEVWNRRKPWFVECSSHDFFWSRQDSKDQLSNRYFYALKNVVTPNVVMPSSAFVQYTDGLKATKGYDAVFLHTPESNRDDLLAQIAKIRRLTELPIVLNAGNNLNHAMHAIRACVEVVQLHNSTNIEKITNRCNTTRLIVTIEFMEPATEELINNELKGIKSLPNEVIGLKLQFASTSVMEVHLIFHVISKLDLLSRFSGIMVESYGGEGMKLCNLLNATIGPSLLLDLTDKSIRDTLRRFDISNTDLYCLFGKPIQASPSPTLHNSGFKHLALKKIYSICESSSPVKMQTVMESQRFRGASVTIPHKENVLPMMDDLTDAAKQIGAVNTVIRRDDDTYLGDNTDWIGIKNLLQSAIPNTEGKKLKALVVGAGGTAFAACYCVKDLGMELFVHNRTSAKAESVARRFQGSAVSDLTTLEHIDVVVGTVPATAGFQLPEDLIKRCKPVVLDAAYRPRNTKLIVQADAAGCKTFVGVQMLIEQGLAQFERWTGKTAPREVIEKSVYEYYESSDPSKK